MRKPNSKISYLPKAKAWHDQGQACSMRVGSPGPSGANAYPRSLGPCQYLVGQLLIQLLGNGVVELPLKLPWGDPHSVHHLHQDEHPGLRWGLWNRRVSHAPEPGAVGSPRALRPVPIAGTTLWPATWLCRKACGAPCGACSATEKGETETQRERISVQRAVSAPTQRGPASPRHAPRPRATHRSPTRSQWSHDFGRRILLLPEN